jgi:hypothetical protein
LHFLNEKFEEGVDFFLEASFVVEDSPRPTSPPSDADYIDKILYVFHDSFLRRKTNKYPRSLLHYVDVRDVFEGTYTPQGTRKMVSANPFSGSVIVKEYKNCSKRTEYETVTEEGLCLVKFILEHAWDYFRAYLKDGSFPVPAFSGTVSERYRKRLERALLLTSPTASGRVSRVAKQLLKLPVDERRRVYEWAVGAFERELARSVQNFSDWQRKYLELKERTEDAFLADFESIRMYPITCLVALSSVIMDVYCLGRSLYHTLTPTTVYYCGAAHIENYVDFFVGQGGTVTSRKQSSENFERCIL